MLKRKILIPALFALMSVGMAGSAFAMKWHCSNCVFYADGTVLCTTCDYY